MADVFISYKRDERASVEQLAAKLRSLGLEVWFDASMSAGETFNDEIDREARTAKSILVCWSPTARESRWVKAEAMIGFEHEKLAAAYVAGEENNFSAPTPFNTVHAEDLRAWLAAPVDAHAGWRSIVRRIGKLCGRSDLESWGALDAQANAAELRSWLAQHEQSPLFMTVQGMLAERETQDAERARLEREAREKWEREETARRAEEAKLARERQEAEARQPRRTPTSEQRITMPAGKELFGHPRGLWYLCFCEGFERFSYYGMQALLVLYLTQYLLLPGHIEHVAGFIPFRDFLSTMYGPLATPVAVGAAITGLYSSGVYITPLIGGFIADRFLGRTTTVVIGCLLMVLGHFLMAFDVSFVVAILCLFVGVGCFKGNIASQVGELYAINDLRRGEAYQLFFLGIQIAVIAAPIVTAYLAHNWLPLWHWGFGAAGVGMTIALIVYLSARKNLPPDHRKVVAEAKAHGVREKLTARDWAAMAVLVGLLPVLAASALGNQEIFNAYLLWGDAHYQLEFFGQRMPTEFLISLDAIVSMVTMIGVVAFWRFYGKRRKEPDEIVKIAIGSLIASLGPLVLAWAASNEVATGQKASLLVGLGFHILNDIGFAMVFPVGLALYSRAAPKSLAGLFIGVYYLHLALCNFATGKLAGLIETMSGSAFWTMHAGIIAGAGVILLVAAILFRKVLAPTELDPNEAAVEAAAAA